MNVKILGSGSIGNHLAQAARRMGWGVVVVDRDPDALRRMQYEIYPKRYGFWDEEIRLCTLDKEPVGDFDVICIGTPPDVRMKLARSALEERPKILQLEKPLCAPFDKELERFRADYDSQGYTRAIVGYDHAVSESICYVVSLLKKREIGVVDTLDVDWREHWQGIFKAHPWLKGPEDSYLGFTARGGGASGEHSHALHLGMYLSEISGMGTWKSVLSALSVKKENGAHYDSVASFSFITDQGRVGRVIQDVVTLPVKKTIRIQGEKGFIEWECKGGSSGDVVRMEADGRKEENLFPKNRPDDFYQEMLHIKDLLNGKIEKSPLDVSYGVQVMNVLKAAAVPFNV